MLNLSIQLIFFLSLTHTHTSLFICRVHLNKAVEGINQNETQKKEIRMLMTLLKVIDKVLRNCFDERT